MIVEIPQPICCGISMKTKIRAIMPRPPREPRSSLPPSPRTGVAALLDAAGAVDAR
jgi:hypothetical protein